MKDLKRINESLEKIKPAKYIGLYEEFNPQSFSTRRLHEWRDDWSSVIKIFREIADRLGPDYGYNCFKEYRDSFYTIDYKHIDIIRVNEKDLDGMSYDEIRTFLYDLLSDSETLDKIAKIDQQFIWYDDEDEDDETELTDDEWMDMVGEVFLEVVDELGPDFFYEASGQAGQYTNEIWYKGHPILTIDDDELYGMSRDEIRDYISDRLGQLPDDLDELIEDDDEDLNEAKKGSIIGNSLNEGFDGYYHTLESCSYTLTADDRHMITRKLKAAFPDCTPRYYKKLSNSTLYGPVFSNSDVSEFSIRYVPVYQFIVYSDLSNTERVAWWTDVPTEYRDSVVADISMQLVEDKGYTLTADFGERVSRSGNKNMYAVVFNIALADPPVIEGEIE